MTNDEITKALESAIAVCHSYMCRPSHPYGYITAKDCHNPGCIRRIEAFDAVRGILNGNTEANTSTR